MDKYKYAYPKKLKLTNIITIREALSRIDKYDLNYLKTVFKKFLDTHPEKKKRSPIIEAVLTELENPRIEKNPKKIILRALLYLGGIRSYAADPTNEYLLNANVWLFHNIAYPYQMIDEGVFILDPNAPSQTLIDEKLNRAPIFLSENDLKEFLRPKPPSKNQLIKKGKQVVENHSKNFGNLAMRKKDFVKKLQEEIPNLTKHRAETIWSEVVPKTWKKSGRKKDYSN